MKSFKQYQQNPLSSGRLLTMKTSDSEYTVLCVRSETPRGAIILIVDPDHENFGQLVNTKEIEAHFVVPSALKSVLPISNYLYQSIEVSPNVKRVEYHPVKESIDDILSEDIERSAVVYFQQKYRNLKNKDATNDKLNLILEILLTDHDDHRIRFM